MSTDFCDTVCMVIRKMTRQRLSKLTMHIHTLQCFKWQSGDISCTSCTTKQWLKSTRGKLQPFFSPLPSKVEGDWEDYRGLCKEHKTCHVCIFSSWFCHTWGCDKWRNCPSFWARSSSRQPFRLFFLRSALWRWCGTKMAPVPDSVLMCLAVSYKWVQILGMMANNVGWGGGGSHAHRHGWRVLWRHGEERIKTYLSPSRFTFTNIQLTLHTANEVSDVNMLQLCGQQHSTS